MDIQDLTQLPKTRQEAIKIGSKYYFTGKPCKNNHVEAKVTKNHMCVQCKRDNWHKHKEYNLKKHKEYVGLNKEQIKRTLTNWYLKNIEKVRDNCKKYAKENRKQINARYAEWRLKNIEKCRKSSREYARNNPEKSRANTALRRSRIKNNTGKYTAKDIKDLIIFQKNKCVNCNVKLDKSYHVDHIMPISLGGSNDKKNIQILCKTCNLKKRAKHPLDWAQENGRLL